MSGLQCWQKLSQIMWYACLKIKNLDKKFIWTSSTSRCEGSAKMYGLNILPYDSSFPGLPNRTGGHFHFLERPCVQCDQIAILFVQYLATNSNKNLLNSIAKLPKNTKSNAKYCRTPIDRIVDWQNGVSVNLHWKHLTLDWPKVTSPEKFGQSSLQGSSWPKSRWPNGAPAYWPKKVPN